MTAKNFKIIASSLLVGLVAAAAPEAKALTDTQVTPGLSFTITGTQSSATPNPAVLAFAQFNPNPPAIPSNRTNIQLKQYRFIIDQSLYSKQFTVVNSAGASISLLGITGIASIGALGNVPGFVSFAPVGATFTGGPNPIPPGFSPSTFTLSGSGDTMSMYQMLGTPTSQYIGTGTVNASKYYISWTVNPTGTGLLGGPSAPPNGAELAGLFKVEYQYDYDLVPGTAVPGPLPLLGAGAAFGWTRRLRKRISGTA